MIGSRLCGPRVRARPKDSLRAVDRRFGGNVAAASNLRRDLRGRADGENDKRIFAEAVGSPPMATPMMTRISLGGFVPMATPSMRMKHSAGDRGNFDD